MAFTSGTATDHEDYFGELITFLTTDSGLISDNAEWEEVWTHGDGQASGIVLRGQGASGTDNIYVGLRLVTGATSDSNYIALFGMTGLSQDALTIEQHFGVSPEARVWLDSGSMKYWFTANARRFAFVANMSTVYEAGYAGFFLPYAAPQNYPYPMFIGGSSSAAPNVTDWRSTDASHAHFPYAGWLSTGGLPEGQRSAAFMLDPLGVWRVCSATALGSVTLAPKSYYAADSDGVTRWGLSTSANNTDQRLGSEAIRARVVENLGGGYTLDPVSILQHTLSTQNFGILDGVHVCPGQGNSAENVIQIGGTDHLVLQNVWRTAAGDYWTLALE